MRHRHLAVVALALGVVGGTVGGSGCKSDPPGPPIRGEDFLDACIPTSKPSEAAKWVTYQEFGGPGARDMQGVFTLRKEIGLSTAKIELRDDVDKDKVTRCFKSGTDAFRKTLDYYKIKDEVCRGYIAAGKAAQVEALPPDPAPRPPAGVLYDFQHQAGPSTPLFKCTIKLDDEPKLDRAWRESVNVRTALQKLLSSVARRTDGKPLLTEPEIR